MRCLSTLAAHCKALRCVEINLGGAATAADASVVEELLDTNNSITDLGLRWTHRNDYDEHRCLLAIGRAGERIRCLRLAGFDLAPDQPLIMCRRLEVLTIESDGGFVHSGVLNCIAASAATIKELQLLLDNVGDDVSASDFVGLISMCHRLQYFETSLTNWVTDQVILAIAENCPFFEALHVPNSCHLLSDESLVPLAKQCKSLAILDLTGCDQSQITGKSFSALLRCSRLVVFRCSVPLDGNTELDELMSAVTARSDLQ